jgi:hypothetical protein
LYLFHKGVEFGDIEGYDDIKNIVRRVLDAEGNYNLLFIGPPASAKTLFLLGILEYKKGVYFDGSNTTSRILDVLEENRPKIICIAELDKMSRQFQNQLLNFLESGRIKVDQQRKSYDFEIKGAKVSATCNEINRLCTRADSSIKQNPESVGSHRAHRSQPTNNTPIEDSVMPIVSVEDFFSSKESLQLPNHSLEQSPCYPIIGCKYRRDYTIYYCKLHRKVENANLESIEHHCRFAEPDHHKAEIMKSFQE